MSRQGLSFIIRAAVVAVYLLLAVCMFMTGRQHTVLVDNRAAEDGSYKAIKGMTVTVNGGSPSEFMKGDRDKYTVKGQKLVIKVQSFDGSLDAVYMLKIPLTEDSVLVSVPRLAAGMDGAMEHFDLN